MCLAFDSMKYQNLYVSLFLSLSHHRRTTTMVHRHTTTTVPWPLHSTVKRSIRKMSIQDEIREPLAENSRNETAGDINDPNSSTHICPCYSSPRGSGHPWPVGRNSLSFSRARARARVSKRYSSLYIRGHRACTARAASRLSSVHVRARACIREAPPKHSPVCVSREQSNTPRLQAHQGCQLQGSYRVVGWFDEGNN